MYFQCCVMKNIKTLDTCADDLVENLAEASRRINPLSRLWQFANSQISYNGPMPVGIQRIKQRTYHMVVVQYGLGTTVSTSALIARKRNSMYTRTLQA